VLPAARAGASFQAAFWMGKFQGTMVAQTPTGSRAAEVWRGPGGGGGGGGVVQFGVGTEGEQSPGDVGGPGLADGAASVADLQVDQAAGLLLELGRDRLEDRRPPLPRDAPTSAR